MTRLKPRLGHHRTLASARVHAALETERMRRRIFLTLCAEAGLPTPTPECRFAPEREWRFDFAWEARKVALEAEGGVWTKGAHVRGAHYIADMAKYSEAAILGWCVLRVDARTLCTAATVTLVRRALASRPQSLSGNF